MSELHDPVWVDRWLWFTVVLAGIFIPACMFWVKVSRRERADAAMWLLVWAAFSAVMVFGVGLNGCLSHFGCTP